MAQVFLLPNQGLMAVKALTVVLLKIQAKRFYFHCVKALKAFVFAFSPVSASLLYHVPELSTGQTGSRSRDTNASSLVLKFPCCSTYSITFVPLETPCKTTGA